MPVEFQAMPAIVESPTKRDRWRIDRRVGRSDELSGRADGHGGDEQCGNRAASECAGTPSQAHLGLGMAHARRE